MTPTVLAVLAALIPGLLWVWFFYRRDRYRPEPKRLIYRTFVYGMVAVFPAALLETLVRPWLERTTTLWGLFVVVLLGIGLVEEAAKVYAVYRGIYHNPEFDEVLDGIIYGTTAGLGFATLETFLYINRFGLGVAPARALLTTLAHASFTGLAGYHLARAKAGSPGLQRRRILRGVAIATILHGTYDFLILSRLAPWAALGVVGLSYSSLGAHIRGSRRIPPFRPEGDDEQAG